MNTFIILLIAAPVLYWGIRFIGMQISKDLKNKFVNIREDKDEYYSYTQTKTKILDDMTKIKVENFKKESKIKIDMKIVQDKIDIIEDEYSAEGYAVPDSEQKKLDNYKKQLLKKIEDIKKIKDSQKIKDYEKQINEIDIKLSQSVKVDFNDFNLLEKFYLNKHSKKLIKDSLKKVEKGFGAIVIHNKAGEKIYFRKYQKRMLIDKAIYFYNPAQVKTAWFGMPVIHYDEFDPEAINLGGDWLYPMGGQEMATLIFDQNVPKDETKDKTNFMIGKYGMYAAFAIAAIYWIYSSFTDPIAASNTAQTIVANATTIVK